MSKRYTALELNYQHYFHILIPLNLSTPVEQQYCHHSVIPSKGMHWDTTLPTTNLKDYWNLNDQQLTSNINPWLSSTAIMTGNNN